MKIIYEDIIIDKVLFRENFFGDMWRVRIIVANKRIKAKGENTAMSKYLRCTDFVLFDK